MNDQRRSIADAIAPPMLELAICCISMMSGKTSDSPASACGPIRPTKCASTVAVTAMSTTLTTTFGAAKRSSVATIGPSRRRRVRAAAGFAADGVVAAGMVLVRLAFVMALPPVAGVEQRLDDASLKEAGRLRGSPTLAHLRAMSARGKASFLRLARDFLMTSRDQGHSSACERPTNRLV